MKNMVYKLLIPLLSVFVLKKYGGIWGLKKYLQQQKNPTPFLSAVYEAYFYRFGSWIGVSSQFNGIPCFPHGLFGIFVSGGAKIGKNVVIFQQVTIGSNTLSDSDNSGAPVIGDNTYIGAGAKIIGNVTIGENCRVGANAVVYKDMPPNSVAVQSPTRIIQKTKLDNRHYSQRNGRWVFYKDGEWIEDDVGVR